MNRLADETSPYLRQHRDNPVDWYPWGAEAFAAAEQRNVPILLSVGYSACHWCHVMAHECFEDVEVAARMNELFVNVKVDREERPDVDAVYMDAVQALTGRGGWPMTVFMTPDREPFYGGTYFPKPQFLALLTAVDDAYRNKPDELRQNISALAKAIDTTAEIEPADELPDVTHLNKAVQGLGRAFDPEWGGFGQAPKFPSTFHLELMLRAYMTTAAEAPRDIVATTLDAMASGGMYDHIGGGFARYSVDREWLVPHFEKMLYDQALLVRTYLHGLIVIGRTPWRQVLGETITYVLATLRHPDGGFYSAEDADSPDADGHGVEGLFHTWTPDEARCGDGRLPDDVGRRRSTGSASPTTGTFEGRSIPNRLHARGELERPPHIEAARQALFAARERRRRPGLDDKVLTEWNALFLSALAEAGAALRTTGLARRRGRQRRVPAPRTAAAERALVAELAGRRRTAGSSRRARRRPRRARRRLHAARGGHRAGPLDPRGGGGRRHDARLVLGSGERRPLHDRRGCRGAHRPPEGPGRQRDAVGQLHGRDRAVSPGRPHR